ncbi:MAG: YceI family protein [Pseudomonadota bacterium]|nr:YceI family protein [Pseudomonadota bacterium]
MKKLMTTAAAMAALMSPLALNAAEYDIDKSHTQIILTVNHLGFSDFYMEVMDYEGGFTFDPEAIADSTVNVVMDATSVRSDSEKLDGHLRGKDFFMADVYPDITFKSTGVEMTGENTGILKGNLTIKTFTKPVKLNVTFNKAGENPFSGAYHAGFSAKGTIKRSDFGIKYALPAVSDEVSIIIEIEGMRKK